MATTHATVDHSQCIVQQSVPISDVLWNMPNYFKYHYVLEPFLWNRYQALEGYLLQAMKV